MSNKEMVMKAVEKLPEEVSLEEILKEIAVLTGQKMTRDEVKKRVAINVVHDTALLSEPALAEDWNRPEEDAAWAYLQPAR